MTNNWYRVIQVLVIILLALAGLWSATEYVALAFSFAAELGNPWLEISGYLIYAPWMVLYWDYQYGVGYPEIFQTAALFSYGGPLLGIFVAYLIAAWNKLHEYNGESLE